MVPDTNSKISVKSGELSIQSDLNKITGEVGSTVGDPNQHMTGQLTGHCLLSIAVHVERTG